MYTPGVPEVAEQFHVSTTTALVPFSLHVFRLGFGPILGAPLSEKLGRSGTYLISMPIFAVFTLGAGFSKNFASLLICRLLAGILASPPLVVAADTITDVWEPQDSGNYDFSVGTLSVWRTCYGVSCCTCQGEDLADEELASSRLNYPKIP